MKVLLDHVKCTGHGVCESFAPDIFEIDDNGDLILKTETVPAEEHDAVRQAVDNCPTLALTLEE